MKLFVTEKELGGKPIAMAWDERGRLWVSVTVDYPNELQPEGEGRDKIVLCEDTDGDGVCDKVTTFADKLSIPTSLLPYARRADRASGAAHAVPEGHRRRRQGRRAAGAVHAAGAPSDTHAGPSNLRYGFDNWIYGIGRLRGLRRHRRRRAASTSSQGFYRFKVEQDTPHGGRTI